MEHGIDLGAGERSIENRKLVQETIETADDKLGIGSSQRLPPVANFSGAEAGGLDEMFRGGLFTVNLFAIEIMGDLGLADIKGGYEMNPSSAQLRFPKRG